MTMPSGDKMIEGLTVTIRFSRFCIWRMRIAGWLLGLVTWIAPFQVVVEQER